jgi:hypothetical protein
MEEPQEVRVNWYMMHWRNLSEEDTGFNAKENGARRA